MKQNPQFINGLMKELRKNGYDCTLNGNENEIDVTKNGVPVLEIRPDSAYRVFSNSINDYDFELISSLYNSLNEAYSLYANGESLEYANVPQYHKLSEFANYVLAACLMSDGSLQYATWQQDSEKTRVDAGHYSDNYEQAKEEFATRCGLVNKHKLFNETEMKLIRQGLVTLACDFPNLSTGQLTAVGKAIEKIEMLVPEIQEHETLEENELVADDELSL